MPANVEALVRMPDARNTFSLAAENFEKFKGQMMDIFGDKELHEYRHNQVRNDWDYSRTNPLKVKKLGVDEETEETILLFEGPDGKFPLMLLDKEPKFAFLESIIQGQDTGVICGIYLSTGRYFHNPWVGRDERIYVAKTQLNEQLLR